MNESVQWLDYVLLAGFALVALLALRRWRLGGGRAMAIIGGAVGLLAIVSAIGKISEATDYRYRILFDITIAAFLGSGYLLILFRHQFLPVPRWIRIGALVVSAGVGGYLIYQQLEYGPDVVYEGPDMAALLALVGVWAASVLEPSIQFWRAARKRPTVQRARLRSLSAAYLGIILILIVALALGQDADPTVSTAIQASTLALIPLLAAAITPPRWLRRIWRAPEEEALRASRHLVMFAADRVSLAGRALEWATRLVGGDAGFIALPNGDVLAEMGISHEEACDLSTRYRPREQASPFPIRSEDGTAIVAPFFTETGICTLVVLSGPFAQLFGTDEIDRLGDYAEDVGVALDRAYLTEEMQRLDEARRAFIANAAHELRTPLTAILGFSSMVAADPVRMPPEQLQQAMEAVHRHSLRMRTLVNNLLDLTQIDAGKLNVNVAPVSLPEVARQALETAPVPPDKSVSMDVPDVKVNADRLRLEQVFANLLVNAYKYGGPHVDVDGYAEDRTVVVTVTDDGPGIAEPLRSRLFEPFVRGAAVGKEGSGLGLAIVRSLLRAFGGDIWYEDASPKGARFCFRLECPD